MKKRLLVIATMVLALLVFNSCTEEKTSQIQMVSKEEMKDIIKSDHTQLIDVRTIKEFEAGHIKGAQNIVYDEDFANKISQ